MSEKFISQYKKRVLYFLYQGECDVCGERVIFRNMVTNDKERLLIYVRVQVHNTWVKADTGQRFKIKAATVDHIHPSGLGGTDDLENLSLKCTLCHEKETRRVFSSNPRMWVAVGDRHFSTRHKSLRRLAVQQGNKIQRIIRTIKKEVRSKKSEIRPHLNRGLMKAKLTLRVVKMLCEEKEIINICNKSFQDVTAIQKVSPNAVDVDDYGDVIIMGKFHHIIPEYKSYPLINNMWRHLDGGVPDDFFSKEYSIRLSGSGTN